MEIDISQRLPEGIGVRFEDHHRNIRVQLDLKNLLIIDGQLRKQVSLDYDPKGIADLIGMAYWLPGDADWYHGLQSLSEEQAKGISRIGKAS